MSTAAVPPTSANSASGTEMSAAGIAWNLSALFQSVDDPKIGQLWETLGKRATEFAAQWKGNIDSKTLTPQQLAAAIGEYESIANEASKPMNFAQLLFAADTSNPAHGAFLAAQMEKATSLNVKLLFFELELQNMAEDTFQSMLSSPELANFRHFLTVSRAFSNYRLSEKEEVILEEAANTGARAWVRLFEEVTANYAFKYTAPGATEPETLSMQEVLALFRSADRNVRKASADAFTAGLKDLERVLVFTYNNLLQDKAVDDRLRGLEYPEKGRHLANELDKSTVDLVIRLCRENYPLVSRYYTVKREILGLPELTHVDRYAPLFEAEEKVSYEEARQIILDAFGGFNPTLSTKAGEFFEKDWIDASPRKGKQGGAFCCYNSPDTHPVVFQTYMDKPDDVMTLAHELGHGVHASLSRAQSYLNFHGTLPLAELASTFGEMLVFESLIAEATTKDQLALYAEKIEGVFATIFRQAAMFQFEQRCHKARREEGELAAERIGGIWQEELQAMFGDSVKLGEQHETWWSYVSHFVAVPFYVYAYSFGELLVLSLYEMAKKEGPSFGPKYVAMLTAGGSLSPDELMAMVGVDLRSEAFWQGGFHALDSLVTRFEAIWAKVQSEA